MIYMIKEISHSINNDMFFIAQTMNALVIYFHAAARSYSVRNDGSVLDSSEPSFRPKGEISNLKSSNLKF